MDYGSDIDAVVLFDRDAPNPVPTFEHGRLYIALAETIVKVMSSLTKDGSTYRVDMRLRPEGKEGRLASSLHRVLEYLKEPLAQAADKVLNGRMKSLGGNGGVIAIDARGEIVLEFNSEGMFRGLRTSKGWHEVAIYR